MQVGRQLRDSAGQDARLLETEPEWEARDPDHVLLLCKETIELGKSVLVFCGTKRVGVSSSSCVSRDHCALLHRLRI